MGLFNRNATPTPVETPEARAAREERGRIESARILREAGLKQDKMSRSQAKSAGFPTAGARVVLFEGVMSPKCIVIRDGQVEYFTKETGALWQSTNGRHLVLPMSDVQATEVTRHSDVNATLSVSGATGGFSIKTLTMLADLAKETMDELMTAAPASQTSTVGDEKSPTSLLKELAALHTDGILSDEEFAAKKAEVLRRM